MFVISGVGFKGLIHKLISLIPAVLTAPDSFLCLPSSTTLAMIVVGLLLHSCKPKGCENWTPLHRPQACLIQDLSRLVERLFSPAASINFWRGPMARTTRVSPVRGSNMLCVKIKPSHRPPFHHHPRMTPKVGRLQLAFLSCTTSRVWLQPAPRFWNGSLHCMSGGGSVNEP